MVRLKRLTVIGHPSVRMFPVYRPQCVQEKVSFKDGIPVLVSVKKLCRTRLFWANNSPYSIPSKDLRSEFQRNNYENGSQMDFFVYLPLFGKSKYVS